MDKLSLDAKSLAIRGGDGDGNDLFAGSGERSVVDVRAGLVLKSVSATRHPTTRRHVNN